MNAFDRMGQTLTAQMSKTAAGQNKTLLEFGTITSDLALKVPRFDTPIPKGEYWIDARLSLDYQSEVSVETSTDNEHSHTVGIPLTEGVAKIAEGDMVLVCWVDTDPVVISKLADSANM